MYTYMIHKRYTSTLYQPPSSSGHQVGSLQTKWLGIEEYNANHQTTNQI